MSATISELLDAFESLVRQGLDEFMLSRGADYESGFSRFEGEPRQLRPRGGNIPGLFWFICRYSLPEVYLEIGYGDKESLIQATLGYPAFNLKHDPWTIAEAAGCNERGLGGGMFVTAIPSMRETMTILTSTLEGHWDLFESPSEELFDRAQQILGHRLIFDQEAQRQRDRQRDAMEAATAFHTGDYRKTIELLTPYSRDDEFSDACRKMFALARRKGEQTGPRNT